MHFIRSSSLKLSFTILSIFIGSLISRAQLPPLPPNIVVDTTGKDMVKLLNSEQGTVIRDGNNTINIVVGDVAFEHNGDYLYADSARLNLTTNTVHAYGDVSVLQTDGTTAYADRLYYNGKTSVVELYGSVELSANGDFLWAEQVVYNLKTQIGSYTNNGTLQSGNTVVSSHNAVYNVKTSNARFKRNVIVIDPEYQVNSQDLNYNTQTRVVTFYGPSVIQNDSATLYTQSGTYDAAREVASFDKRATIVTQGQYMTADKMDYNRVTGLGVGRGSVVAIDSTRNITMWGEYGTVNELTKQVMVTERPFLRMIQDSTALYVKADTFYSEPVSVLLKFRNNDFSEEDSVLLAYDLLQRAASQGLLADSVEVNRLDSVQRALQADSITKNFDIKDSISNENELGKLIDTADTKVNSTTDSISYRTRNIVGTIDTSVIHTIDTTPAIDNVGIATDSLQFSGKPLLAGQSPTVEVPRDTSELRYILAYRGVLVYSDSIQAKCDSMSYSQLDSIMQLFYNPVIWTRNAQVIGNTIIAKVDSSTVDWVRVPQNGIMISKSFPTSEVAYDQIQGNELLAYFTANEVDSVIARGSSASIYYAKDESDAVIGISEATANDIHIRFDVDSVQQRRIKEIVYYQDFVQTMHPITKTNPEDMKLSRFQWREEERPKTLDDFLAAVTNEKATKNIATPTVNTQSQSTDAKKKAASKKKKKRR